MTPLSYFGLIFILGISAQWIAWKVRLPSILFLLAFGFLLSITTHVTIDDYMREDTLLSIVSIFVAIILFEGGMTLKLSDLKEAGTPTLRLCTLTVGIGAILTFLLMRYILNYEWQIAALLASILTVTGPTVVGPLLRVIQPSKKIANIVKWEGIIVDPIGAILALIVYQVTLLGWSEYALQEYLGIIIKIILVGIAFPIMLAKGILLLLKRHLIPDYLHSVFLLAVVAGSFAIANSWQAESGLLTVTILGMALVNQKAVSVRHILEFKENLKVLIISLLFIILSGRIQLASIQKLLIPGLILILTLVLVIRPVAVYLAMLRSRSTTLREQTFLAFLAPRGIVAAAVCSVFALEFEHAAHDHRIPQLLATQAQDLVPLVFLCIIGTVSIYGVFALPLAKKLQVTSGRSDGILFAGAADWIIEVAKRLQKDGHTVFLMDTKYDQIAKAKLAGVPALRANILSEYAEHGVELSGIGQLIAVTPNDEVNSLACIEFGHTYGRKNAWQIAPEDRNEHHSKAVSNEKRARICFSQNPNYKEISYLLSTPNYRIKKSQLTKVFTIDHFFQKYGSQSILLFFYDEKQGLRPATDHYDKLSEETTVYSVIHDLKTVPN